MRLMRMEKGPKWWGKRKERGCFFGGISRAEPLGFVLPPLALLLYFIPLSSYAQDQTYAFNFDHLTIDQGLSHTTVHAVLEDQKGMIWIGTRFGLNRYDGYEFKTFLPDQENEGSIGGHTVYSLLEDQGEVIWIGHQDRGISLYTPKTGKFSRFPETPLFSIDWETVSVRSLFEDRKGNIWIGTYGAGAVVLHPDRTPMMQLCSYCEGADRKLENDFVFDFAEDANGNIWIGTAGKGLEVYDPTRKELRYISPRPGDDLEGFGKALCLDKQGMLWIGTAGKGLYQLALPEEEIQLRVQAGPGNGLSHNLITDLAADAQGQLWVATDGGGLNCYHPSTQEWQQFYYSANHPGTLNTNALYDLMLDRHDNLWVGTFNGGINLHRDQPSPFASNRAYIQERLRGLRSVLALAQDPSGTVWLGTDGAGLFKLHPKEGVFQVEAHPISEDSSFMNVITSVATTPEGHLWLGSYGKGLLFWNLQTGTQRHFTHNSQQRTSLSHNNVWDLAVDEKGGLWVGTLGGGLNYLPVGEDQFVRFADMVPRIAEPLSGVQIVDLLLDRNGQYLWVATESAGLNRVHLQDFSVQQYHSQPENDLSLSSERLRCLYEDQEGAIWIGTEYAGINRLEPRTGAVQRYTREEGLPSEMINGITQGPEGMFWISTQAGISRWDREAHEMVHLGSDTYLENNQFNPKAVLNLADGRTIWGSTNGYVMVEQQAVQPDTFPPAVMVADLYLSNQPVPIGKAGDRTLLNGPLNDAETTVQLSYEDRGLQFLFATTHAAQSARQEYEYRLVPYERKWQRLSQGMRTASYSGLPGGKYTLKVRAIGPSGRKGTIRSLALSVDPPFWQKNWFFTLCLGVALLLLWAIIAYLLQRQRTVFRSEAMKSEQEILRLRNENLEKDVANQQARLSASVLQAAHKNEVLNDLKSQLKELQNPQTKPASLKKVLREIDRELKQEDYWQQFQLVFDRSHTQFMQRLQELHPKLTDHEKRLCCFIRMQLSNREVASILNITVNGVEQAKYRIKKKLRLEKATSLNDYIRKI